MRVAIVDLGSNSSRLLLADVEPGGAVDERRRETEVTRLAEGVDAHGRLSPAAVARVRAVLDRWREDIAAADANLAVLTSAVRDAQDGGEFAALVCDAYGLDARVLSGDEEAAMTFLGATSERDGSTAVAVVDIGGGSTEFVVGRAGREPDFHVSTQAGAVRHGERHVAHDPPLATELAALAQDAHDTFAAALAPEVRREAGAVIAVAGTATSLAAVAQDLDPYDPARVHGYRLTRATTAALRDRLAALPVEQRRGVAGLHPRRAETIVPGSVLLLEAMDVLGVDHVEVSEHDILRGAALRLAR